MWYNRLSEYLLKEGYKNDSISPCIFIKRTRPEYVIIAVYVDDHNIIGTPGELPKAVEYLKKEFEMKDFGKTKFCLGLQIEHLKNGILVHQNAYTKKLLKRPGGSNKYMKIMQHALLNLRTDTSKIRSSDNLADLFTKALPTATFKKLVHGIGMRRLKELK
ncbi:retrovirus-related pol polyprotein from transposon TNT 1-94 [Tanacetum coccineum]